MSTQGFEVESIERLAVTTELCPKAGKTGYAHSPFKVPQGAFPARLRHGSRVGDDQPARVGAYPNSIETARLRGPGQRPKTGPRVELRHRSACAVLSGCDNALTLGIGRVQAQSCFPSNRRPVTTSQIPLIRSYPCVINSEPSGVNMV